MMAKYGGTEEKNRLMESSSEDEENSGPKAQDLGSRQARIDELCKSSDEDS